MNKQEFVEKFNEVNEKVEKETGGNVVFHVTTTGMTLTTLVKAHRARRRGNYGEAIFYLILWHSLKTGYNEFVRDHKSNAKPAPSIRPVRRGF